MAELLKDATAIANGINEIIRNAETQIVIITPYLKIREGNTLQSLLRHSKKPVVLIVRADQTHDPIAENRGWLEQLKSLRLYKKERLHTKCYVNEKAAIVTSQNLWENTRNANWELGIKLTNDQDQTAYAELCNEIKLLINSSSSVDLTTVPAARTTATIPQLFKTPTRQPTPSQFPTYQPIRSNDTGHCIRCYTKIELNPERPYCPDCYQHFRRFGDGPTQKERYCHRCGRPHQPTLNRPLCRSCYHQQAISS